MELLDFLRARLDEDEQVARAAKGGHLRGTDQWTFGPGNADGVHTGADTPVTRFTWPREGAHIARHDPARVLAECAAKRRIVERHPIRVEREWENPMDGPARQVEERYCAICGWVRDACDTVKDLASVYAERADYRAEWALTG